MTGGLVPEESVVDAVLHDPLGAATLLSIFSDRATGGLHAELLTDICRDTGLGPQRVRELTAALQTAGLIQVEKARYTLSVPSDEAVRHAAVLHGVAYAHFRHRDANHVEITLSPPAHPSRLMEVLPRQGFSWARLYYTKDSLIELASRARRRLVVISPFLDREGLEWIGQFFEAATDVEIERILIVRGRDNDELTTLAMHWEELAAWRAKILTYAITHEPGTRWPAVETFHAKIILADADKAYIGSANMNRWSRDFSMECGAIISGPAVKPVATLVEAIIGISGTWPGVQSVGQQ